MKYTQGQMSLVCSGPDGSIELWVRSNSVTNKDLPDYWSVKSYSFFMWNVHNGPEYWGRTILGEL